MANIRLIKVFLASPGDVAREGELVRQELESINHSFGEREGVQFKVVNWKTDSFPAYGDDGQALLNEQIAQMAQYDLFIGIMWNRFGTPTPRAASGTEEEFLRAVDSYDQIRQPHIMFYFNQQPYNPANLTENEQKGKVLEFKGKVQSRGLTHDYNGVEDFQRSFRNHVELWLVNNSPKKFDPPHIESEPAAASNQMPVTPIVQAANDPRMWILLKHGFFLAEEVNELAENTVLLKIPINSSTEDAVLRELKPGRFNSEPIAYAYQDSAAVARVTDAKRVSVNGRTVWEFSLKLEENHYGPLSEASVNGISPDEIAERRARFILLNESPKPIGPGARTNLTDSLIWSYVTRISPNSRASMEGNILPDLWKNSDEDAEQFQPLARLWVVFHLITSHTCQYILELVLGPIADNKIHIKFRGQRHRRAINVEPFIISVEGDCDLKS